MTEQTELNKAIGNLEPERNLKLCIICGIKLGDRRSLKCKSCSHKGKINPAWKGDKARYHAIHRWVERRKEKPLLCSKCKQNKKLELSNISGKYKRDIFDYEWVCRSCHFKKHKLGLNFHHKIKPNPYRINKQLKGGKKKYGKVK